MMLLRLLWQCVPFLQRKRAPYTDVVWMELLMGARTRREREGVFDLVGQLRMLTVSAPADFEQAAEIYRACRERSVTIRRIQDLLIAACALRFGAEVLHADRDFTHIAECTDLRVYARS